MQKHLWWIVPLVVLGWLAIGLMPMLLYKGHESDAGAFGDSFGIANSMASTLALIIAIISIASRSKELEQSIKDQTQALKNQETSLRLQEQLLTAQRDLTRNQIHELATTQLTAKLQAFAFLADYHLRQLQDAPQQRQDSLMLTVDKCIIEVSELLKQLQVDPATISLHPPLTKLQRVLMELDEIMPPFFERVRGVLSGESKEVQKECSEAIKRLGRWVDKHDMQFRVSQFRSVCHQIQTAMGQINKAVPDSHNWRNFQNSIQAIRERYGQLRMEFVQES